MFPFPSAGPGYFVILCDGVDGNPFRFDSDPWRCGRAFNHFRACPTKEKCHGAGAAGEYSPEAIMERFAYRGESPRPPSYSPSPTIYA